MATPLTLLDQASEDALHKSRLLNVEEKTFKRITKRLLSSSPISIQASRLPTPPPENAPTEVDESTIADGRAKKLDELRRFRADVQLDFAAFESSIARMQFLRASNERERERYAAEKLKIQETAHSVRENTATLRVQLAEAQHTLAIRKTYDELANKITSNKSLRPRDEQRLNLEKLRAEIEELDREKSLYAQTWAERREQFGKLVEEGQRLRRLIRDEKEEAERREGMEEDDHDEQDGDDTDTKTGRGAGGPSSAVGTPRLDGSGSGVGGGGSGLTPLPSGQASGGAATPVTMGKPGSSRAVSPQRLTVPGSTTAGNTSAANSTKARNTPTPSGQDLDLEAEAEDTDMADEGEVDESEDQQNDGGGGGIATGRTSLSADDRERPGSARPEDVMDMT